MGQVSVNVRIPALDHTYDFIVPDNMSVHNVRQLMIDILSSEYGISDKSLDALLFDMKDNKVLPLECSFIQLGISDGAELCML